MAFEDLALAASTVAINSQAVASLEQRRNLALAASTVAINSQPLATATQFFDIASSTDPNNPNADYTRSIINIVSTAVLFAPPPVEPPPSAATGGPSTVTPLDSFHFLKRASYIYPAPTLDALGRPDGWQPSSVVRSDWGRWQVVVGGVDVTYFRGVACIVDEMIKNEPMGDAAARIIFPQVSQHEALPEPFARHYDCPNTDVFRVDPAGVRDTFFEGMLASYKWSEAGLVLECIGGLYQADLFNKAPSFRTEPRDVSEIIRDEFLTRPTLRTGPVIGGVSTILTRQRGGNSRLLTGYIQDLLATAQSETFGHLSLIMDPGRMPHVIYKDVDTVHWTFRIGTPGILTDLTRERLAESNVYYGEGVNTDDQCRWRNTKYPNLNEDTAPVWPGTYICGANNMVAPDREAWAAKAQSRGYAVTSDGACSAGNQAIIQQLQADAGIAVDGIVGPQTWAATFETGSNSGDLTGAYFAPLVYESTVEPSIYNADGSYASDNPDYDSSKPRIESYTNYGTGVAKDEATLSARLQYERDATGPNYFGTITFRADPENGSRFDVRASHNILVKGLQGADVLFHCAQSILRPQDLSVVCTVDTKARDMMTLAQIRRRDRDAVDPMKRPRTYRNSRQVEDRIQVFDCEAGGGTVPRHGIQAGLWNVLRIPFGEYGTVVGSEFTTDAAARFSVAVFDRPTTHQYLQSVMGSPLEALGDGSNPWDSFAEDQGLIIAWGGPEQAAGYYPGSESNGDSVTGRLVDNASWSYVTQYPGWLWVAMWCESTTYISGQFRAGVEGFS